mmetsp:Transcript_28905/g.52897  ORF Transcript_28905/g.52897 Transcript_28905/m.52897 type:complete len:215 (+) Transcript_28905:525-1169(+)
MRNGDYVSLFRASRKKVHATIQHHRGGDRKSPARTRQIRNGGGRTFQKISLRRKKIRTTIARGSPPTNAPRMPHAHPVFTSFPSERKSVVRSPSPIKRSSPPKKSPSAYILADAPRRTNFLFADERERFAIPRQFFFFRKTHATVTSPVFFSPCDKPRVFLGLHCAPARKSKISGWNDEGCRFKNVAPCLDLYTLSPPFPKSRSLKNSRTRPRV